MAAFVFYVPITLITLSIAGIIEHFYLQGDKMILLWIILFPIVLLFEIAKQSK